MNKVEIINQLTENHKAFTKLIRNLPEHDFTYTLAEKWSVGQQLDHILRSVSPVNLAFGLPAFVLRLLFGKANRASRSYAALVEKYQKKLRDGGKAPGRFIPPPVEAGQREALIRKLNRIINSLVKRSEKYSEEQLDTLLLPHPLLGKLTLREMLYFTVYHVQHHHKQVINNLQQEKH
jgi:hypothetical protein